jgi:hypothetical protein
MKQRGRKSTEALAVVRTFPDLRPAPPEDLTEEQATEWRAIVARMPGDWFPRETHATLASYCRHVCTGRMLSRFVDKFEADHLGDEECVDRLKDVLRMRETETRAASALARAMRLTQQSRYRADAAATAADNAGPTEKPWEDVV